ncbi:MAG: DUF2586 family protein [Peptococcaceae bacterium]|nr:DUF2586 family protein [Peptococcaceae bacterium]
MLPDVRVNVLDGGLGVVPPGTAGLQAKVGVCSAGTVNEIVSISDPADVSSKFGTGPLADALYDAFAAGASIVYAVRASGDVAGTVGEVSSVKTGQGNMTAAGSPLDEYEVVVEIVDPGAKNVATFKYSLDGGDNFSSKITVPTGLTYDIPGTGITLTFSEYVTDPSQSFLAGDKYTFSATAPSASVNSVNAAIDALLNSNYKYEFIHVVGPSDNSMWAALDAKAAAAQSNYRFIHFLAEARGPNAGETVDQWATALLAMKANFASSRVSICAGRFEMICMGTGRQVNRNGAGIYSGRVSSIPVGISPGKVMYGPLPSVVGLRPAGINDGHILSLDEAGFITFRQYVGLSGFYVTNGRIAAESVSDYKYVELRRPMDKACALVRAAALQFEHAEIDPLDMEKSLTAMEAVLTAPLDAMAGAKDISRGRVVIPRNQDILATSKLRVKVRIVPLATLREIELEIGFENPFQNAA